MYLWISSCLHSAKMAQPSWQSGFLAVSLHMNFLIEVRCLYLLHFDLLWVSPEKKLSFRYLDPFFIKFLGQIVSMFNIYLPLHLSETPNSKGGAIHLSSPSNEGTEYCMVLCVQNGQKLEIYIQSHIPILAIISLLMSSLLEIFKNDPQANRCLT